MADDSLSGLLEALLAVQKEAPTLPKDKTNPAFKGSKYTPLDTIVERIGPLLSEHGLVWSTFPCSIDGNPALRYVLAHAKSGVAMEGTMPLLLDKQNAQGMGSAITYARRYSLCAVLNLVADEDDDGVGAGASPARGKGRRVDEAAQGADALARPSSQPASDATRQQIIAASQAADMTGHQLVALCEARNWSWNALTEDQATALMMSLPRAKVSK